MESPNRKFKIFIESFLLKDGLTQVYVDFFRAPLDLERKEYRSYVYVNHLIFKFNILKFSKMISI